VAVEKLLPAKFAKIKTRQDALHLMMRRGRKTAKVAMARKLAVRLYWMMRQEWDFQQWSKLGSHAGQPGNRHGVQ
jgi:transposase